MSSESWSRYGAASGAVAIVLFLVGGLVIGDEPEFDAGASEVAAFFADNQERIQLGAAIEALWAPLFVWFLATVASVARATGPPGARRAGTIALACGSIFLGLFLVDVTALAVAALRPENMAAAPELAAALRDASWLAQGMAAPLGSAVLLAFAFLTLRHRAVWPEWLGWLAMAAALIYMLRIGTLFTADGPFAADGVLGLWVPVGAIAAWIFLASLVLALSPREHEVQNSGVRA